MWMRGETGKFSEKRTIGPKSGEDLLPGEETRLKNLLIKTKVIILQMHCLFSGKEKWPWLGKAASSR